MRLCCRIPKARHWVSLVSKWHKMALGMTAYTAATDLTSILIDGGLGNDSLLRGGGGADTIFGGDGVDRLEGQDGNDLDGAGADSLRRYWRHADWWWWR